MNREDERNGVVDSVSRPIWKYANGQRQQATDTVVQEKALTIQVNGMEIATVICSPWQIKTMAVGFLCAEGILRRQEDLLGFSLDEAKDLVQVSVSDEAGELTEPGFGKRYVFPSGGRNRGQFYASVNALLNQAMESDIRVTAAHVLRLSAELEERSRLFHRTGGVHNAALADGTGIILFHEDIGRHNTLDKILGQCFLEGIDLTDKIIVFSGRVSSEILLKTAKMGVSLLISRSAPTDLALQRAEKLGITVVGFAREDRFNIYTHGERIID